MAKLSREDRMTIKALIDRGSSNRELARLLGVSEGAVRYHRRRQAEAAPDGRAEQQRLAAQFRAAIDAYLEGREESSPANVAELHAWLIAEHDYPGTVRSVQRYVRGAFPAPRT